MTEQVDYVQLPVKYSEYTWAFSFVKIYSVKKGYNKSKSKSQCTYIFKSSSKYLIEIEP